MWGANRFLEDRLGEEVVTGRRITGDRVSGACPCAQLLTLLTYLLTLLELSVALVELFIALVQFSFCWSSL